jgi:CheY-like chemotaxis protein
MPEALEELQAYMTRWHVLLACPTHPSRYEMERRLKSFGARVETVDDPLAALQRIEETPAYAGIVFDRSLLELETDGLLQAVIKLQPSAGVVLLDGSNDAIPSALRNEVVVAPPSSRPDDVLQALIQAREHAGRRRDHAAHPAAAQP